MPAEKPAQAEAAAREMPEAPAAGGAGSGADPGAALEDERIRKRRQEADEVAALLRDAFGDDEAVSVLDEPIGAPAEADGGGELGRRGPTGAVIELEEPPPPSRYQRAYAALYRTLAFSGLAPEVVLVILLFVLTLWLFGFPSVLILGAAAVLILLDTIGVNALNLLAIGGLFLITWELADLARQWPRIAAFLRWLLG